MHIFKYVLWKFYRLLIHLSKNDNSFQNIAKNFIELTHDKINDLKIFKNINLSTQIMHNIQLCDSCMINIDLSHANIILQKNTICHFFDYPQHEWNFCVMYMNNINFYNTNLSNVTLLKVDLKMTDFSNANLSCSRFIECKIGSSMFDNANLTDSLFDDCEFIDVRFINTSLQQSKFIYCSFSETKFINCNLTASLLYDIKTWSMSRFVNCESDSIVVDADSEILIMK